MSKIKMINRPLLMWASFLNGIPVKSELFTRGNTKTILQKTRRTGLDVNIYIHILSFFPKFYITGCTFELNQRRLFTHLFTCYATLHWPRFGLYMSCISIAISEFLV